MNTFSVLMGDTDTGPLAEPELVEWLEGYRSEHPEDHEFHGVVIHELPEPGTLGHRGSPWDFVTRPGN